MKIFLNRPPGFSLDHKSRSVCAYRRTFLHSAFWMWKFRDRVNSVFTLVILKTALFQLFTFIFIWHINHSLGLAIWRAANQHWFQYFISNLLRGWTRTLKWFLKSRQLCMCVFQGYHMILLSICVIHLCISKSKYGLHDFMNFTSVLVNLYMVVHRLHI